MSQQFKGQYDDEEVLFAFKKHPVVMRRGLIYAMIALLLGTIPSLIKPEMSYFWGGLAGGFILAIVVMFPSWIYWYFSVNIMTDQRFVQIVQKGFFKKRYSDIGIQQVQSVNYQVVGIQETLLGFGTVIIQTYLGDIVINDVHKPQEITKELSLILREHGSTAVNQDNAAKTSHDKIRES